MINTSRLQKEIRFLQAIRHLKQAKKESDLLGIDLYKNLSPSQYRFAADTALKKNGICGRRAGKTTVDGRILLHKQQKNPQHGENPPLIAYVAPTRGQAKKLMWGRLQFLVKKYGLPVRFNHSDLIAKHENGCEIWLMGADTARDIERLRGFAFVLIIIDEAQAIGIHMKNLVDDILDPALADYKGQLILTGTPNAACTGFFHDASNLENKQWSNHKWTVLDNCYFPQFCVDGVPADNWQDLSRAFLEKKRIDNGWSVDNPTYLREWLGRWIRDITGLVYRFDESKNLCSGFLPDDYHWQYVLGVDLGYDDAFATSVVAFTTDLPFVYEVENFKESALIPSQWADHIRQMQHKYNIIKTVVDTGGLGKAIVKEFNQRKGLTVYAAEKKNKFDYIQILNSDLHESKVRLLDGGHTADEMARLQYTEDRKKEDPRYPNHCSDAFLYAYREARHWLHQPAEAPPKPGTVAEQQKEMQKLLDQYDTDEKPFYENFMSDDDDVYEQNLL